jgi:hypothetical protein
MSNTFFVTDQFSAAFPSVHQPSTDGEYASGKYEVSGFLTREANTDGLMSIAAAVQAAITKMGWSLKASDLSSSGMSEMADGSIKCNFRSKFQPTCEDAHGATITDPRVSPGDSVRVAGKAQAWEMGGRKGVSLYLNSLRVVSVAQRGNEFGGPEDYAGETNDVAEKIEKDQTFSAAMAADFDDPIPDIKF